MASEGVSYEIEGIGELDYGGVAMAAVDKLVEEVAKNIVAPEVQRNINNITHETERSIKVKRHGYFDPRGNPNSPLAPTWSVWTDIYHAIMLEYGYGGKDSYMRKTARSRRTSTAIGLWTKQRFGNHMKAQVRKMKKRKKK